VIPIDCALPSARPALAKLWAQERIRDLDAAALIGRRQESTRERCAKLAIEFGVMSAYTSFVVIETRSGDRRASGLPETRPVPVSWPAGWGMQRPAVQAPQKLMHAATLAGFGAAAAGAPARASAHAPPPTRAAAARKKSSAVGVLGRIADALSGGHAADPSSRAAQEKATPAYSVSPLQALLGRQLASGLWDEGDGIADDELRQMRATARALLELLDRGINSSHPLHGAQIKKAIEALLQLAPTVAARDPAVAELALGVAWLAASGHRTRKQIEVTVAKTRPLAGLRVWLADEQALRARLDQLSA
jgi:Ca-activated chloride channel family protein